jgi:hypothetical protein
VVEVGLVGTDAVPDVVGETTEELLEVAGQVETTETEIEVL